MHKYSLLNSKSADIPEKRLSLSDIKFIISVSYCKSHCTEPLFSIVSLCTPLYKVTALHCTPLTSTVLHCASLYGVLKLYSTVTHCTYFIIFHLVYKNNRKFTSFRNANWNQNLALLTRKRMGLNFFIYLWIYMRRFDLETFL